MNASSNIARSYEKLSAMGAPANATGAPNANRPEALFLIFIVLGLIACFCGCGSPKPQSGGRAEHISATATNNVAQGENAKESTLQQAESQVTEKLTLPPGSKFKKTETTVRASRKFLAREQVTNTITTEIKIAGTNADNISAVMEKTVSDQAQTKLGAAQKDFARELAVNFAAMRPVLFFGLAMVLVAGALFYFKWWTKGFIALAIGILSIAIYQIFPTNPWLIVGGGTVIFGIAALLVYYAYHKGRLDFLPQLQRQPQTPETSA
jgi:hypothetical protein